jgi:diphosphomevalonate decarboxylase
MFKTNKITLRSPSNIAIVKYWGKQGNQIPMNPSLSFTLDHCHTETSISWKLKSGGEIQFLYDGQPYPAFGEKVKKYITNLQLPWSADLDLVIDSKNNFPHSAGIASSASAMSALALCLVSLEEELNGKAWDICEFRTRASELARLGSGSACRSVYPEASLWGKTDEVPYSSDHFGIDWSGEMAPEFKEVSDWIFIVSASEKSVSSTAGHKLMENHIYREGRIAQARQNLNKLITALRQGDWIAFTQICEEEALSLHGLMMSSRPSYVLLEPDSLRIIHALRKFRQDRDLPIAFTIDAGPNIHLLFESKYESTILEFVSQELKDYLSPGKIIKDKVGKGPVRIR